MTSGGDRRSELAERLRGQLLATLEVYASYLGDRLGLYGALAEGRAMTSLELAQELGLTERYVREWLEQQAVAAILEVDDVTAEPGDRRFRLPADHAPVFVDPTDPAYSAAALRGAVAVGLEVFDVMEAFRTGGGLEWPAVEYEEGESRDANRATFERELAGWLRATPSIDDRLSDPSRGAAVADVGCGAGWSSLAIAAAYPAVRVHGVEANARSVELAARHAHEAGLEDRVTFTAADAAHLDGGPFELICFFECLHDMPRPVDALRRARERLAPDGSVLVADEKTAEVFTAPGDELERSHYAWSVLSCLPYGMSGADPAGTGTVMRPATLRRYSEQAGLGRFQILPIEHPEWRFYLLTP